MAAGKPELDAVGVEVVQVTPSTIALAFEPSASRPGRDAAAPPPRRACPGRAALGSGQGAGEVAAMVVDLGGPPTG